MVDTPHDPALPRSRDLAPIRRALLTVSNKIGLVEFAAGLRDFGVEIVSTGGTARALRKAGIQIVEIEDFTGFPEILDGRVKTLHPKVHAGLLYRRELDSHAKTVEAHGFQPIDLLAVNLYPFEETVRKGSNYENTIEQIDIGGPCLIRSAAKNHDHVTVVVSPESYTDILEEMRKNDGATTLATRKELARRAFQRTSAYDAAIQRYFESLQPNDQVPLRPVPASCPDLPEELQLSLPRERELRYGENPHQRAALYGSFLDGYRQLHGKELSYNNILDLTAAQEMADRIGQHGPAVVIVKHSNPCGAAVGAAPQDAWTKALATDSVSASGGIVACSQVVGVELADAIGDHFIELLVAPEFTREALQSLKRKKNRILLQRNPEITSPCRTALRSVPGGFLAQTIDDRALEESDIKVVTSRDPTADELAALKFGWDVVRFVKSNAIVFAGSDRTLGIGAGQMSRVDSVKIATRKAREANLNLAGSVIASDAFFPFPDGVLAAADAGATAVIQPGGSVRDEQVIAAAQERGMAMVFTGARHFRH